MMIPGVAGPDATGGNIGLQPVFAIRRAFLPFTDFQKGRRYSRKPLISHANAANTRQSRVRAATLGHEH